MKKKEKKTKKVALRDLKPRKAAGVKGGKGSPSDLLITKTVDKSTP